MRPSSLRQRDRGVRECSAARCRARSAPAHRSPARTRTRSRRLAIPAARIASTARRALAASGARSRCRRSCSRRARRTLDRPPHSSSAAGQSTNGGRLVVAGAARRMHADPRKRSGLHERVGEVRRADHHGADMRGSAPRPAAAPPSARPAMPEPTSAVVGDLQAARTSRPSMMHRVGVGAADVDADANTVALIVPHAPCDSFISCPTACAFNGSRG